MAEGDRGKSCYSNLTKPYHPTIPWQQHQKNMGKILAHTKVKQVHNHVSLNEKPNEHIYNTDLYNLYKIYSLCSSLVTGNALVMFSKIENLVTIFHWTFLALCYYPKTHLIGWQYYMTITVCYMTFYNLEPSICRCFKSPMLFHGVSIQAR